MLATPWLFPHHAEVTELRRGVAFGMHCGPNHCSPLPQLGSSLCSRIPGRPRESSHAVLICNCASRGEVMTGHAKKTDAPRTEDSGAPQRRAGEAEFIHNRRLRAPKQPSQNRELEAAVQRLRAAARRVGVRQPITAARVASWLFGLIVCAALGAAYVASDEQHIVPGSGIGYALGIAGSVMMLLLLLYPARKSWKRMSSAGSVRVWFIAHMVMGVVGPALVVVHSNFQLLSTNATVAMVVMLLVVGSGLVGRYIYSKIYVGMTGRRAELDDLLADAERILLQIDRRIADGQHISGLLNTFDREVRELNLAGTSSLRGAWALRPKIKLLRTGLEFEARQILAARALRETWNSEAFHKQAAILSENLDAYFSNIRRAVMLQFFTRLFALWHIFHMPLFLLLIMVASGHVIAVHMF
jgi:hypothetical protein